MNKRIKLSVDFVISDEKKEVAVKEAENTELATNEFENTELVASNNGNIIIPRGTKRKRRKKLFTMGLVIVGMLLAVFGGYGIATQVDTINDSAPVERGKGVRGEMSERLINFPTDDIARAIMERGYYYELDNVVKDGSFKMELVAATGETYTPLMLLNIHVDSEELITQYDKIEVFAYCLEQSTYDNDIQSYSQWKAYGVQDEVDPHVYHVTLPVGSDLSTSYEPVVFDMTKIRFESDTIGWVEYDISLKETLSIPYLAFYPGYVIPNTSYKLQSKTIAYELSRIDIGYYSSSLEFSYDVEESLGGAPNYFSDYSQFYTFIQKVVLEINGVEYRVDSRFYPTINKTEDGREFYVNVPFPGVVEDEIKSMVVKYRDTEYKIR